MWRAKSTNPKIFFCYRREDSQGQAGRLYDAFRNRCGAKLLFRDVDTIHPGDNFPRLIEDTILSCKFFIVIIGRGWLHSTNQFGRRLEDPGDFVRREITTALKNNKTIIPVLVQGATMPEEQDLPNDLKQFAQIQGLELRDTSWDDDLEKLFSVLSICVRPAGTKWRLFRKLLAITIISTSVLFFFFRADIIQRLLSTDTTPPVEELFFPSFLLVIGLFILNYKTK